MQKLVTFRVSEGEHEALKELVQRRNKALVLKDKPPTETNSTYLRTLIREQARKSHIDIPESEDAE